MCGFISLRACHLWDPQISHCCACKTGHNSLFKRFVTDHMSILSDRQGPEQENVRSIKVLV